MTERQFILFVQKIDLSDIREEDLEKTKVMNMSMKALFEDILKVKATGSIDNCTHIIELMTVLYNNCMGFNVYNILQGMILDLIEISDNYNRYKNK